MKPVRVGIAGFGNVGRAVAELICESSEELESRVGVPVVVTRVCRRTPVADIPVAAKFEDDCVALAESPEVDLVVETMGGTGRAADVVFAALAKSKPVVTANKNLLAQRGHEIQGMANRADVPIGIEAAVAGGIPVLRAINEGMTGDRLQAVYGILNGTTNYILTRMERSGIGFEEALSEAQGAGYAEADPSNDIDGIDSRDKLCILARLAFHSWLSENDILTQGIRSVTEVDIDYARQLNCTIRLIGCAQRNPEGLAISVRPWVVNRHSMLAKVEGVNNAVFLRGERIGQQMFYGPGAGAKATATAVVSDVVEIARALSRGRLHGRRLAGFEKDLSAPQCRASDFAKWYLRLTVSDRPGIIADVSRLLADLGINIDSVFQKPGMPKDQLSFVITVECVREAEIQNVISKINGLEYLLRPVLLMRMNDEDSVTENSSS